MKRREELDKYRDFSDDELTAETARLKESLFRLKFKLGAGRSGRSQAHSRGEEIAGATANAEKQQDSQAE